MAVRTVVRIGLVVATVAACLVGVGVRVGGARAATGESLAANR